MKIYIVNSTESGWDSLVGVYKNIEEFLTYIDSEENPATIEEYLENKYCYAQLEPYVIYKREIK